jgi:hypothetical protein
VSRRRRAGSQRAYLRANGKIVFDGVTSDGSLPARVEKLARGIEGVQDVDNSIEKRAPRERSILLEQCAEAEVGSLDATIIAAARIGA